VKLKRDQVKFVVPELFDILSIVIEDHNGLLYPLQRLADLNMDKMKEKEGEVSGRPIFYSLVEQTVTLHPRCEKDYNKVHVEYVPPKRVL
jgi:hypothetical protein